MPYLDGKRPQQALPTDAPHNHDVGGLLHELILAVRNSGAKRVTRKPAGAPEAPGSHRVNAGVGSSQQEALRAVRGKRDRVSNTSDDDANEEAMKRGGYSRAGGGVGSG